MMQRRGIDPRISAWFRCSTRAEAIPDTSLPCSSRPPITHTVFWYDTIIA